MTESPDNSTARTPRSIRAARGTALAAGVAATAAVAACVHVVPLAVTPSVAPVAARSTLHGGFGRAEITPPPGHGLLGYGPAASVAVGFGQRLYARALVLED